MVIALTISSASLNSVRLIGRVYRQPVSVVSDGKPYTRVLLEIDEQDYEGNYFCSYHSVVMTEELVAADGGVNIGDLIMISGRVNNYTTTKGMKTNIHAKEILVLMRNSERLRQNTDGSGDVDVDEEEPVVVNMGENVVSIFGATSRKPDDEKFPI